MNRSDKTRRRDFLKGMIAVPAVWSGALGPTFPASKPPGPLPFVESEGRSRRILSEGWHIKQLGNDTPDISNLMREAATPDTSWLPARMPAQVHEILLAHKRISDPHLGKNAAESAWVGEKDWVYATTFAGPSNPAGSVFLHFQGLDTLAAVYLNGRAIARFDNMFREYRLDVREHLAPAGRPNLLLIVFSSPLRFIERYPQLPAHKDLVAKHKYLRKSHGDFGSYLGARPHSVKVGVFRDIVLDVPDRAWIEDVCVRTDLRSDQASARLTVLVETAGAPAALSWTLTDASGVEAAGGTAAARPGMTELVADIRDPKLWWPRTHGVPHLYTLRVDLRDGAKTLDIRTVAVGIRDVKLVLKDPATGEARFRFEVNGRPIALYGACWTPVEGLTHCWPRDRALRLLDLAEAASMNAFRLWAEGYLPPQEFYDECDRRGIFVWQDFMFGYSMHPSGIPAYDANGRAEVEGVVRSLRNHPCLLLWVGGNENHMGLDFAGVTSNLGQELFGRIMPEACAALDPTRPFHPSSPFGGPVPNWPLEGDFHDYTAESFSPEASVPAFTSEVGRVTVPSLRNMRRFLTDEEIWPPGFDPAVRTPGRPAWPPMWAYRTFSDAWDWAAPFESFCDPGSAADLIRLLGTAHGEHLRQRLERQRRGVPDGAPAGSRRSWGNLVWCYNDSRPVIQFGLIDYYQEPKIPYYFVRRAYDPVLISFERSADRIFVWVVNDSPRPVAGPLKVTRARFDGTVRGEISGDVSVSPGESRRCLDLTGFGPISLRHEFLWARFGDREATLLLIGERYLILPPAKLDLRSAVGRIDVATDAFARQVVLEVDGEPALTFEDNFFDLPPKTSRSIAVRGQGQGRRVFVRALNAGPETVVL